MNPLIARAAAMVVVTVAGFGHDDVPAVPSIPVQIGTHGTRHGHPQAASWQMLILMFVALIVLGTAVLLYVVRQRRKIVARRRMRRMAEAVSVGPNAPAAQQPTEETPPSAEPTTPGSPSTTAYPEPHVRI